MYPSWEDAMRDSSWAGTIAAPKEVIFVADIRAPILSHVSIGNKIGGKCMQNRPIYHSYCRINRIIHH